ncbi:recombinase family protein [Streptomyces sp. NPDC001633]|uniref:recombinase family protein n=1 Tax=Streptomyces sp. NPDC001633 TaxID=3364595 RepID=UPI0036C12325
MSSPRPAQRTGALVGYARVSTKGQLLDRQIHALNEAGCIWVFADKKSGKNAEREELWAALDCLRPGDTLVVPSLDRLGRSIQDLIVIVSGLRKRGVGFTSLHEALDTTTPPDAWSSTSSPPWPSSSANSWCRAPTRAWTSPAPAAPASDARRP